MTTRERWSLRRYQAPHLHVHAMRRHGNTLELEGQSGIYRLACDSSGSDEAALEPILTALRDPGCNLWHALRQGEDDVSGLASLLHELDHLGLIRETAQTDAASAQMAINNILNTWSADLGREMAACGSGAVQTLRYLVDCLAADASATLATLLREQNFSILTIRLQARYLRVDAPGVLALIMQGLIAAEHSARMEDGGRHWDGIGTMPSWAEEEWTSGLVEPAVLRHYLRSIALLVVDAVGHGAARQSHARRTGEHVMSGINFMIELEGDVAESLAELGPSPAFHASQDPALALHVVKSAFLQEYLVTCRFTECIAPLLSRRFAAPLRDAVHRYFAEEVGHERFERQNCLRLGLTEAEIDSAELLPLHLAFIDIVTSLAHQSPVAFFCASMFTEGLIANQDSLVSLAQEAMPTDPALLRAIGHHVAVNDEADHRGVGRDWMSHVAAVSPAAQTEIRELIAYLGELNWRMWDKLVQSSVPNATHFPAQYAASQASPVLS